MGMLTGVGHLEPEERANPEVVMARLLGRYFDMTITPESVDRLFELHWNRLSLLAHLIHDKRLSMEVSAAVKVQDPA